MAKAHVSAGLLAGCLLLAGGTAAWAAPTVAQMLTFKPRQKDVAYATPSADEQKDCKVELVTGAVRGSSGWLLRDPRGQPLRRFFDTNGDKKIDMWSYYKDGVEVYREVDTANQGVANQYRWLNSGGTRWGVDVNQDEKIDTWRVISAEEVGQEVFQALATQDAARFRALLITDAEIQALKLPAAEANRIREQVRKAPDKFQEAAGNLPAKAQWGGLESAVPRCVPADALGTTQDLYKYPSRTIRYDYGDNKHDWMQTGELIQVGLAWRLADGPSPGDGEEKTPGSGVSDPDLQKLLQELAVIDGAAPPPAEKPGPNPAIYEYNIKRVAVVERIVARVKPEEREQWVKQEADCLSTAAQNSAPGDKSASERLAKLRAQVVKEQPGSALAGYVTFRELWAEFAPRLQNRKGFSKVQEQWLAKLREYVQAYPTGEDTPDALVQLGMGCEFNDHAGEAKKYYQLLVKNFAEHPLAAKGRGAVRRLELEGKTMELSGPTLAGGSYDLARLRGKVVIVYYWASYCEQCPGDFAKLKLLLANQGSRGVELVCVNVDDKREDALQFLKDASIPANHLYQPGGLASPLAVQYGIMGLPNLFLIGKDNKVVSRTVQINDLEDEVKKLLAK